MFPGIARRPARLEYWGDEIERLREFSPSTQLSTKQVGAIEVSPVRELLPDDELRSIAAERARPHAGSVPRRAPASGRRAPLRRVRHARAVPLRAHADAGGAPSARLLDRGDPRPAHVPTSRADSRGGRGARRGDRMAGPEGAPSDRGSDRGSRAAASDRVHGGTRSRHLGLGNRRGQPGRAGESSRAGRGRRHEDRARRPRPRFAAASRRGPRRSSRRADRGAPHGRVPLRARPSRRRHRGGSVRLPAAHAERAEVREPSHEVRRGGAGARRLRGSPDPRRRSLRGRRPPRARRSRARLPDPRVREQRQAVRAVGAGRHGGEVSRRRRTPAPPSRQLRLGPGDREGQARRQGHGGGAGSPLQRPHGDPGTRVRPGHAVAARAGGRVPVRGDAATR